MKTTAAHLYYVFFVAVLIGIGGCQNGSLFSQAKQDEVLVWHPGSGILPKPIIYAERFKNNDLGISDDDYMGQHAAFGSVVEYFCGDDPQLREEFAKTFMKYHLDRHNMLYPGYEVPENYNCSLWTYRAPYEFDQADFLQWLHEHTDKSDFFEPKARESNEYRGNVLHPWTTRANVDEAFLTKTFGYAAYPQGESVVLLNDNRYNPLRWIGPVNEVHHHEQPSLFFIIKPAENQWQRTAKIFNDYFRAQTDTRILLEYDIELTFNDYRLELDEKTIWDFYEGADPIREPGGILSQTHSNTWRACRGEEFGGKTFNAQLRRANLNWMENRIVNSNLQCSVAVNFRERDKTYRLMEFMICGKDHAPHAWSKTPSQLFNEYAVDGGSNDTHGWYRASIELLRDERFVAKDAPDGPVLIEADPYIEIFEGRDLETTRVKGIIDLTRYYEISRNLKCFPGQKAMGENGWMGFEGENPETFDPDEQHGIEWVGFIFENHGPFRIKAKINELNVRVVKK